MEPIKPSTKWLNFFERVLWTLLQVATAEGAIAIYEEVAKTEVAAIWTVVVTVLLAAVKNAAAQAFGSPTGATLPEESQPVLAEKVLAISPPPDDADALDTDRAIAWTGSDFDNGDPVRLIRRAA